MRVKSNWRFVVLAFAILFVTITASAADQKTQDLYKSRCQGCHGADGKATSVGKKLGAKDFQEPDVANASQADLVKNYQRRQRQDAGVQRQAHGRANRRLGYLRQGTEVSNCNSAVLIATRDR